MTDKILKILRGVPGSGKSTRAREIIEEAQKTYLAIDLWSADNYFIRPDGVYDFNGRMLKNAHRWCREGVEKSMRGDVDGETGNWSADLIILDNTNIMRKHYQAYLDLAKKHGYKVTQCVMAGSYQNIHGVPIEKVEQMRQNFEVDEEIESENGIYSLS